MEENQNIYPHFDFGVALSKLKEGKKVCRSGWNGKNMFAVLSPGHKDLPHDKFFSPQLSEFAKNNGGSMDIRPTLMLKTAQDDVAYWVPSCSDILAEDWMVVD